MWQNNLLKVTLLCGMNLFLSTSAWSQTSILETLLQSQSAIVEVKAQGAGLFKPPTQQAAMDPRTGRIILVRNAGMATFERNGAGVIIHPSGIIATNAHIASQAKVISVTLHDQTTVPAQVISFEPNLDLCLLKIAPPEGLTYLPLADSNGVKLGDEIFTVGNSAVVKESLSGGKVIGLGRSHGILVHGTIRNDLIQTTIDLYKGDSGGPLFNRQGQLIGLMTAKEMSADHSSFAIPSNQIALHLISYLNEIKAKNEPADKNQ